MKSIKIGTKITLGGLILLFIPLLVIGSYSIWSASKSLESAALESTTAKAKSLADLTNSVLKEGIKIARTIVTDDAIMKAFTKAEKDDAAQTLAQHLIAVKKALGDEYEDLFVAEADGNLLAHSLVNMANKLNLKDREYFNPTLKGESFVSNALKSKTTGNPVVIITAPIKVSGKIVGVFGTVMDISRLSDQITAYRTGETGYPWMVDRKGLAIVHPNKENILKTDFTKIPEMKSIIDQMLNGDAGVDSYVFKGDSKIAGFAPVPLAGWSLAVTQNRDEFMAPVYQTRNGIIIVSLLFLGLTALILILAARRISKPITRAATVADAIALGDLTLRMDHKSGDEIGLMAKAFNTMADSLEAKADLAATIADGDLTRDVTLSSDKDVLGLALQKMVSSLNEILGQVHESVSQVDSGAGQVAESSQSLSQGATEQAASLEEISSSMTEIGAQTKTNAENAGQANQLSLGVRDQAESGNKQMEEMIEAMSDINASSKEIAKIIKAIDDIAFQTNLLALNAAVEAARAGKHGKGFAVVAQEVRNLAGRSAKAAKETEEMIESSLKKVEKGTEIVNITAESLGEMASGVTKVNDIVGEIASASQEQAGAISQISQALGQIDQVTQQNTASAEETAAAAEQLSSQSVQLSHLLDRFKLKDRVTRRAQRQTYDSFTSHHISDAPDDGPSEWPKGMIQPSRVIALDDSEFGKY